jgi:hypothetical protein
LIVVLGAKSSFVRFSPPIAAFGSLLSQTGVLSSRRSLTQKTHRSFTGKSAGAQLYLFDLNFTSIVYSTPCSGSTADQPIANPQGPEAKAD